MARAVVVTLDCNDNGNVIYSFFCFIRQNQINRNYDDSGDTNNNSLIDNNYNIDNNKKNGFFWSVN